MNTLVVFGRAPEAGSGKSRLRSLVGSDLVDRLYEAFVADILGWDLPTATSLVVALSGAVDGVRALAPSAHCVAQAEVGFGERIRAGFDAAFELGAERVVMVGTDCPTLPAAAVDACFSRLAGHRATLVPAVDGGWVALGLDAPLGDTLDDVPWSSDQTGAATRAALDRAGRPPALVEPWYDVDDADGLERLCRDLRGPGRRTAARRAPRTAAVVAAMSP